MEAGEEAVLMRIFIGEDDVYDDQPLADAIVLKARAMGLAGATVLRGALGFGPASRALEIVLRLSEDRPVVVEIVDRAEPIDRFVAAVETMMGSGMITLQPVTVRRYGPPARPGAPL